MTRGTRRWPETTIKISILDDYQNVALQMADWTAISKRAEVTVFNDHLSDPEATARNVVDERVALRGGGWQQCFGEELKGKTLGVPGLGNVGGPIARIGSAFGMKVIAWSQNMTAEVAQRAGAELFARTDILTIHLVLSDWSIWPVAPADRGRDVRKSGEYGVRSSRMPRYFCRPGAGARPEGRRPRSLSGGAPRRALFEVYDAATRYGARLRWNPREDGQVYRRDDNAARLLPCGRT
jgi:D-isomer specific 2-hydroxyacid dehydrogenase, NAD binding domain